MVDNTGMSTRTQIAARIDRLSRELAAAYKASDAQAVTEITRYRDKALAEYAATK